MLTDTRPMVALPRDLQRRCWRFGLDFVESLKNPPTQSAANSAAVSSHGIERDPIKQAWAKMAECAFCYWGGVDVEELKWETDRADPGSDIKWNYFYKIDVKHTFWPNGYLIWPVNKRSFFDSKDFDILVLVRGKTDFELAGWCWKREFRETYYEIGGAWDDHFPKGLTRGTWVYTGRLTPMRDFMYDGMRDL